MRLQVFPDVQLSSDYGARNRGAFVLDHIIDRDTETPLSSSSAAKAL